MSIRNKFYPWSVSLPKKLAVNLATLSKIGNLKAPGTWGSAVGILFYIFFFSNLVDNSTLGIIRYLTFSTFLAYLAIGICDAAERALGVRDPGKIILDEFVAINFCFLPFFNYSIYAIAIGFLLFRLFDITKPLYINKLQSLEGGLGCVIDDIAAAILTCISINIIAIFAPIMYIQTF